MTLNINDSTSSISENRAPKEKKIGWLQSIKLLFIKMFNSKFIMAIRNLFNSFITKKTTPPPSSEPDDEAKINALYAELHPHEYVNKFYNPFVALDKKTFIGSLQIPQTTSSTNWEENNLTTFSQRLPLKQKIYELGNMLYHSLEVNPLTRKDSVKYQDMFLNLKHTPTSLSNLDAMFTPLLKFCDHKFPVFAHAIRALYNFDIIACCSRDIEQERDYQTKLKEQKRHIESSEQSLLRTPSEDKQEHLLLTMTHAMIKDLPDIKAKLSDINQLIKKQERDLAVINIFMLGHLAYPDEESDQQLETLEKQYKQIQTQQAQLRKQKQMYIDRQQRISASIYLLALTPDIMSKTLKGSKGLAKIIKATPRQGTRINQLDTILKEMMPHLKKIGQQSVNSLQQNLPTGQAPSMKTLNQLLGKIRFSSEFLTNLESEITHDSTFEIDPIVVFTQSLTLQNIEEQQLTTSTE